MQTLTVLWLGGGIIFSAIECTGFKDIKHTDIHTAERLVLKPSAFEVELAIEKLKSHKTPGTDQIPAELIKAGGRKIHHEIHKLNGSIWNEKILAEE